MAQVLSQEMTRRRGNVMDMRTHPEDLALARLRAEFIGHRIFRAVRADGLLGEWVATLHDPAAGVDPTVMCPTPEALRAALVKEAERAECKRAWVR
ncbi:hypothetical protein ACH35V_37605 [Actinomadura sp. 1N219]|uniref:hypothetical protein n=1 Tax=Actinomadura sp. 1N219 TaxID=3375152 RepID=UPI00378783F2